VNTTKEGERRLECEPYQMCERRSLSLLCVRTRRHALHFTFQIRLARTSRLTLKKNLFAAVYDIITCAVATQRRTLRFL